MKISKETWTKVLKVLGTLIAAIAGALGVNAMN